MGAFGSGSEDFLPSYMMAVRGLLHDPNADYFSDGQLTAYINAARRRVCVDTNTLRKTWSLTLPANQSQFQIGSIVSLDPNMTPPGNGVTSAWMDNGAGAVLSPSTNIVPMTISIVNSGVYVRDPIISFFSPGGSLSSSVIAVASGARTGNEVTSVDVLYDSGQANAQGATLVVNAVSPGTPAQLSVVSGAWELVSGGTGFAADAGAVLEITAGTDGTVWHPSILDCHIASIDQVSAIWGAMRYPLRPMAYSDFKVQTQAMVGYQSVPSAFAMNGQTLCLGPTPNQSLTYEMDCVMYPEELGSVTEMGQIADTSAIECVPYFACYMARAAQGDLQSAEAFMSIYKENIQWAQTRFTTRMSAPWPFDAEG